MRRPKTRKRTRRKTPNSLPHRTAIHAPSIRGRVFDFCRRDPLRCPEHMRALQRTHNALQSPQFLGAMYVVVWVMGEWNLRAIVAV